MLLTVDGLAPIVRIIRWVPARTRLLAELANVNPIDGHLALAVVELLFLREAGQANIADELIYTKRISGP
jgi:hypothetical protein